MTDRLYTHLKNVCERALVPAKLSLVLKLESKYIDNKTLYDIWIAQN